MRRPARSRRYRPRSPLGAVVVLIAIAAVALLAGLLSPAPELRGAARAVDGDTLRIGSTRVRLIGIDAVERDQTCRRDGVDWSCGRDATDFLGSLIRGAETRCTRDGRDRYGRTLARCSLSGVDIGSSIVRAGWATAELEYAVDLADARLSRRGIWAGEFDDPEEWRRHHGEVPPDLWDWLLQWWPH